MRSHYCGKIDDSHIGEHVELCGWVHSRRDHGGVIFIDLRDHEGIVQIVFNPDAQESFAIAERARSEFVLRVRGQVRHRPEGTENPEMFTGRVEVDARELEILGRSDPLPFQIEDDCEASEEVRLRHRYLDLRRPLMQGRLRTRAQVVRLLRDYLDRNGFCEIETPFLTRSTPEGARDYLVPSRTHTGAFFALPQSPQLFKQLLMMSGFDRYYQIVRCFRDEDLRADRQPEFTQLDIETAFMGADEVIALLEPMVEQLFAGVLGVALPVPFQRMTYHESVRRYGVDRPDLRIPLELVELSDAMGEVEFKVFAGPAHDPEGRVAALRVPGGAALSRKEIDDYTSFVGIYGAKGLAYIKVTSAALGREGLASPILKFLPDAAVAAILERTGATDGDLIFFGADKAQVVNEALGALRVKLGHDRGLIEPGWRPVWIVDFPMFERDRTTGQWAALHHPFTAPNLESPEALLRDPGSALSRAYDLVLNGTEIGGGSVRIHNPQMQSSVFQVLGIGAEEANEKFGFLLEAMRYGCPPHAGIAFGLDRLIMLMTGASSIREVIAFPKTQTASCLLTRAPSKVSDAQLRELGIRHRKVPQA